MKCVPLWFDFKCLTEGHLTHRKTNLQQYLESFTMKTYGKQKAKERMCV